MVQGAPLMAHLWVSSPKYWRTSGSLRQNIGARSAINGAHIWRECGQFCIGFHILYDKDMLREKEN